MKNVIKTIDVNAHIVNVKSQVSTDAEGTKAIISFDNLGYGVITAVKFNAKGFNSFNDVVLVNGKDNFIIIIQDISINKNSTATEIKVKLPSNEIKRLELEECQICYANGTVSTYQGKNEIDFELEEFTYTEQERVELNALKDVFDSKVTYNPIENEYGWICTCGRLNAIDDIACSLCNHTKSEVKFNLSESGKKAAVEKKAALDIQRKEDAERKAKEKVKNDRNKKIGIGVVVTLAIVVICLIANSVTMSKRETYSSEDAMQNALQGKWTHYSEDYGLGRSAMWQWVIDGDTAYRIYNSDDKLENGRDITWNPSKGTFKIGSYNIVVKKGGRSFVEDGDDVFEKGGYLSSSESSSQSSSYESAYTALKFSNVKVSSNSSYTICTGTVTNNGNKTYKFVQIKGSFKDSSGTVIDTDSTYAVGSEGLAPGESKTFRMSVDKNYQISSCSVSIYDYD